MVVRARVSGRGAVFLGGWSSRVVRRGAAARATGARAARQRAAAGPPGSGGISSPGAAGASGSGGPATGSAGSGGATTAGSGGSRDRGTRRERAGGRRRVSRDRWSRRCRRWRGRWWWHRRQRSPTGVDAARRRELLDAESVLQGDADGRRSARPSRAPRFATPPTGRCRPPRRRSTRAPLTVSATTEVRAQPFVGAPLAVSSARGSTSRAPST